MTQRIPGIDVSAWQPHINWQKVAAAGNRFAFIKSTEGERYVSPTYEEQASWATVAGLLVGPYHFARWELDNPEAQAEHFANRSGDFGRGTLPPVLDLEWCSTGKKDAVGKTIYHRRPSSELAEWALRWLKRVHADTGRIPLVYTGPSFAAGYLPKGGPLMAELATYPLWTIDYSQADKPDAEARSLAMEPRPIKGVSWQWDIVQWTGKGRVDGVTKADKTTLADCDRNWFRGTETELRLFAGLDGGR